MNNYINIINGRLKLKFFGLNITIRNPFAIGNNKVVLLKNGKEKKLVFIKGFKVKFYGSNNKIVFYEKVPKMKNVYIQCGENANINIGKSKHAIKNLFINARSENAVINIGNDFSIESGSFDFHGEPDLSLNIGDDCQFGCNIDVDLADGHTVYDEETKTMLNHPKDITIGNHVWLCKNVSILKGAVISDNCIVAKGSIVTGKHNIPNTLIAGIPAKTMGTAAGGGAGLVNLAREGNDEYEKQQGWYYLF